MAGLIPNQRIYTNFPEKDKKAGKIKMTSLIMRLNKGFLWSSCAFYLPLHQYQRYLKRQQIKEVQGYFESNQSVSPFPFFIFTSAFNKSVTQKLTFFADKRNIIQRNEIIKRTIQDRKRPIKQPYNGAAKGFTDI